MGSVNTVITLQEVDKSYDEGRILALQGISLDIIGGQWLSVTGRSGSGKSTLLALLAGLDTPTRGKLLVTGTEGLNSKRWSRLRATSIGFIFQSFNLLPTLTALENVEIPMFGVVSTARQRHRRASELLDQVGLAKRSGHYPTTLSGGERQRVAIARALANDPDILLADEPTGNLDSATSMEIMSLFRDIHRHKKKTLVVVTHEKDIAALGDRTIELKDGSILSDTHISG